jgi:hypothetical protein
VGLDINPTFTNGAFTGVSNLGLRVQNVAIGSGKGNLSGNVAIGNISVNINQLPLSSITTGTYNTAIGSGSANINGRSGVIDYNQSIPPQSTVLFTFTNTSVNSNSVIFFSLRYFAGLATEAVSIQNYSIAGNTVTLTIANSDLVSTSGSVFVNFLIVN